MVRNCKDHDLYYEQNPPKALRLGDANNEGIEAYRQDLYPKPYKSEGPRIKSICKKD